MTTSAWNGTKGTQYNPTIPPEDAPFVTIEFGDPDSYLFQSKAEAITYVMIDPQTNIPITPEVDTYTRRFRPPTTAPRIVIRGIFNSPRFYGNIRSIQGDFGGVFQGSYERMFYQCNIDAIGGGDNPVVVLNILNVDSMFSAATSHAGNFTFVRRFDVSNVQTMNRMFLGATTFNQDISQWNVSNVHSMWAMFLGATTFNQNIGRWNVSNVRNMASMFDRATAFKQDIGRWNVSKVYDMRGMFDGATSFNQDIGRWVVSNVDDMARMFKDATSFNQDIGKWDVSKVQDMNDMFENATSFNQDIGDWNVSNVKQFWSMFRGATSFRQSLRKWNIQRNASCGSNMFKGATQMEPWLQPRATRPKTPEDFVDPLGLGLWDILLPPSPPRLSRYRPEDESFCNLLSDFYVMRMLNTECTNSGIDEVLTSITHLIVEYLWYVFFECCYILRLFSNYTRFCTKSQHSKCESLSKYDPVFPNISELFLASVQLPPQNRMMLQTLYHIGVYCNTFVKKQANRKIDMIGKSSVWMNYPWISFECSLETEFLIMRRLWMRKKCLHRSRRIHTLRANGEEKDGLKCITHGAKCKQPRPLKLEQG